MTDAAPAANDVGRLIDQRPMSPLQIGVAVLCGLAIFLDGYDIQVMALAVPSLSHEWGRPPSDFGLALSAVLIGLTIGGGALAFLGDRYGRRFAVIGATALIGVATACTALAHTPGEFVIWRLLTGVGLGVCVPNCNAWTAEYAPLRRRSLAVVSMNAAVAMGAFSAGFIAPPLIHALGWRGLFLVGGFGPLLVAALLFLIAPESLKFLVTRRPGDPRIARILARIAPDVDPAGLVVEPPREARSGSPLELIGPVFLGRSLLLWVMVALNLFTLYVLISWLPTLLEKAGWSPDRALQGAVLIQLGGVAGGLCLSWFLDRGMTRQSLIVAWLASAALFALFLVVPSSFAAWGLMLVLIGAGVSGAQLCLNALAAAYYPPAIKAAGVGWVGVVGNGGAVAAPLAGAWIIARGVAPTEVLALLVVPVLLCAGGVLLMRKSWQAY